MLKKTSVKCEYLMTTFVFDAGSILEGQRHEVARILHGHGHVLRRRGSSGDSFRSHAAGGERILRHQSFMGSDLLLSINKRILLHLRMSVSNSG